MKKMIYKNMLQGYLEEFIENLNGRKIVILGCRGVSVVVYSALHSMGYDILYFLNPERHYDKENCDRVSLFGKNVYPCHNILYEDISEIALLNTYHYIERIEPLLSAYGLKQNVDYYNIHNCLKSKYCDVFDYLLGYSRSDDMEGFKVFGDINGSGLKIVTLGGSTTDYSYSGVKCWPLFLHEILDENGIENTVINGGICGYSSCQERDKLIRDVLGLKPDIVLSFSGINDVNWTLVSQKFPYYSEYFTNSIIKKLCRKNNDEICEKLCMGLMREMTDYDNWYHNERVMHGVAENFNIRFFGFLQPFMLEGGYTMSDFEKGWFDFFLQYGLKEHNAMRLIYEGSRKFYEGARKLVNASDFLFDISDAFDEYSGVYTDGVHCDESGNKIIAQTIFEKLTEAGVFL